MRSLFLLSVFVVAVATIKQADRRDRKFQMVRLDVTERTVIENSFTLYIPKSLKFGELVINDQVQGKIVLKVGTQNVLYERPLDVKRNEYFLVCNSFCLDELKVESGTKVEVDFKNSNINMAQKIVLFGEQEV